jgi:hypothetical protein
MNKARPAAGVGTATAHRSSGFRWPAASISPAWTSSEFYAERADRPTRRRAQSHFNRVRSYFGKANAIRNRQNLRAPAAARRHAFAPVAWRAPCRVVTRDGARLPPRL